MSATEEQMTIQKQIELLQAQMDEAVIARAIKADYTARVWVSKERRREMVAIDFSDRRTVAHSGE